VARCVSHYKRWRHGACDLSTVLGVYTCTVSQVTVHGSSLARSCARVCTDTHRCSEAASCQCAAFDVWGAGGSFWHLALRHGGEAAAGCAPSVPCISYYSLLLCHAVLCGRMCGVMPPTGPQLLTANRGLIAKGLTATSGIHADGGNGGEAACLRRSERKRSRQLRACSPRACDMLPAGSDGGDPVCTVNAACSR
jgi:hypothetical protein